MVAIHQVLPVFAPRDAIGNHTAAIRRTLHEMGIASEIYADVVNAGAGHGARSIRDFDGGPGWRSLRPRRRRTEPTWLLYHASIGSPVADWFAARPERKLVDYHNITPAETTTPWEPHMGVELEHGRRQLADLAGVTSFAMADSTFNEQELIGLGYRRTAVVPILLDPDALHHGADAATVAELEQRKRDEGGPDWLFVSRVTPHKAQHEVIKAFAAYRAAYGPTGRLHLVGGVGSARYADALREFIEDLGLEGIATLTGSVPDATLGAYYRTADVYVCLSDHEGFGVPLLEAMANDVPVIAHAAGAVTETVGDAGVVLDVKDPAVVAAAVHRVVEGGHRSALAAAGRRRLADFAPERTAATLRAAVTAALSEEEQ